MGLPPLAALAFSRKRASSAPGTFARTVMALESTVQPESV